MRGPSWWGVGIAIVVWGHSLSTFAASEAPPVEDVREELERVKQRLDSLEERERSVNVGAEDAKGHRLHPIHSLGEAKISGGVTMIGQGVSSDQLIDPVTGPGDKAEATLSLDLFLEHQISQDGRVLVHLDVQQGAGLTNIPVFAAPNGNTTGPNNDVESFLSDQVHLDQAYYEHTWMDERIGLTIGQYDPTAYFDTNAFANNERFQFMANLFGNNSALEFGGTGNFYGFGGVLRVKPVDWLDLMVGAMEGDGDFVEAFSRPWTIAEADIYTDWAGRKGTYRVYVWQNRSHFNLLPGGQDVANQGIGLS
ncbi:MAG: carbohydrate porin, partial [Nitrospiria bacterium]